MGKKIYFWLILIFCLCLGGYLQELFQSLENWGINHRFVVRYLWKRADTTIWEKPIVIVGIDAKSIRKIGKWPWPRTIHQQLLSELGKLDVKAVGLDLIFDHPSDLRIDKEFAAEMENLPVVLPLTLDLELYRGLLGEDLRVIEIYKPLEIFNSVSKTGHINLITDSDGVVRWSYPQIDNVSSFSQIITRMYQGSLSFPEKPFMINYIGPSGSFPVISYIDLLEGVYPAEVFQNKIVLVGGFDPSLGDQYVTPLSRYGLVHGVEIHAHQINTILTGQYIQVLPKGFGIIILIFLAMISGIISLKMKPLFKVGAIFGLMVGYYLLSHYIFINHNLLLPYFPVYLLMVGFLIIGVLVSYLFSDQERAYLYQVFNRYLAPQVLEEVFSKPGDLGLGGAKKRAAVLFIDIRGFTYYTHQHQPEEVVELLNRYLGCFAEVIFNYQGTLDKYLGDGLMAVFGSPVEREDDLQRAYQAAMEILEKIEKEKLPLPIGMGLDYGSVVSGNIGSEKRLDFTVIGNTVNTAARLESLAGPGQLVITDKVAHLLSVDSRFESEQVMLKGIDGITTIYRLERGFKR